MFVPILLLSAAIAVASVHCQNEGKTRGDFINAFLENTGNTKVAKFNVPILPGACELPSKAALGGPAPPLPCEYSYGGFHVVCSPYAGMGGGEELCAQFGWRLASVNDLNALYAVDTVRACLPGNAAWVAAMNGLNADPCLKLTWYGAISGGLTYEQCQQLSPVLCQEVPIVQSSTTTSTTTTVSSGTVTVSKTVTRIVGHPQQGRNVESREFEKKGDIQEKRKPEECNDCSAVCTFSRHPDLKLIRSPVTYEYASGQCKKIGCHLADITSGMRRALQNGLNECFAGDRRRNGFWVRSYEGVSGGRCIHAASFPLDQMIINYGLTGDTCDFGKAFALCQCGEPVVTGAGPYEGTITSTTLSFTSTLVITVPETTTTTTTTICKRCHEPCVSSDECGCPVKPNHQHDYGHQEHEYIDVRQRPELDF